MLGWTAVAAPWGPIHIAADEAAVVALEVLTVASAFEASVRRRIGETPVAVDDRSVDRPGGGEAAAVRRRLAESAEAVLAHLAGEPEALAGIPYALLGLSAWDRLVLDGVRRVPWGQVTSYGRLARAIGRPGAARAVGAAVGRNPVGLVVPCHRVIAGDGSLGGYGGSWLGDRDALLTIKRELLRIEAVTIPVASFDGCPVAATRARAHQGGRRVGRQAGGAHAGQGPARPAPGSLTPETDTSAGGP